MMYKVKTLNNISDVIYSQLPPENYIVSDDETECEGILVRSADMHEYAMPDSLLAIARAGAGVNNIPVDECSEKGIVVFNTPGANANAVKELVLCGLLLAGRKVIPAIEWIKANKNEPDLEKLIEKAKKQFTGPELAGKKLGVIGMGAIGVMVANGAWHGLQMEVMGYDPYISVDAAWHLSRSIKLVKNVEEIYRECDFITLHLPLNDKTRSTINAGVLSSMKPGAVLLNFARGGLVDDDAVISALESGQLREYVTDFPDARVASTKGVICIPHLGASTPESEDNCARMAAAQLRDYLENGNIRNSVNLPACELPASDSFRIAIINRNITNMVGQITALLAAEKINIDHMVNSSRGSWAYTMLDVGSSPSAACIERLSAIDGVVRVRVVS